MYDLPGSGHPSDPSDQSTGWPDITVTATTATLCWLAASSMTMLRTDSGT